MVRSGSWDVSEVTGAELYDTLSSLVVPRPIALVSTVSREGIQNLAPFSFFMLGGTNPPSVCFSPVVGPQGEKDSLRNAEQTGEVCINGVHRSVVHGANQASAPVDSSTSEWDLGELSPVPCDLIKPWRVLQSPFSFECKLVDVLRHGTAPGAARYVVCEILRVHVASPTSLPSARLGGRDYLDLDALEIFELGRPE
ncbi:MAG: flavin reductase family protein [Armatimonadetes bacterium]|nr:flavin reductase family protein [Armatimonadota bacterium]